MPTYVYRFIDTDETIEVQQAFTDDALTQAVHPSTGEVLAVRKVFLPVGVTFKGSGFYKNDSRGSSASSTSTSTSSTSSDTSSAPSSSSSTDTGTTKTETAAPKKAENSNGNGSAPQTH